MSIPDKGEFLTFIGLIHSQQQNIINLISFVLLIYPRDGYRLYHMRRNWFFVSLFMYDINFSFSPKKNNNRVWESPMICISLSNNHGVEGYRSNLSTFLLLSCSVSKLFFSLKKQGYYPWNYLKGFVWHILISSSLRQV